MFAALAVPNSGRYVSGQALSPIGTWVETALGAAACLAAVMVVISLAAFAAGVALAMPILKASDGDKETGD